MGRKSQTAAHSKPVPRQHESPFSLHSLFNMRARWARRNNQYERPFSETELYIQHDSPLRPNNSNWQQFWSYLWFFRLLWELFQKLVTNWSKVIVVMSSQDSIVDFIVKSLKSVWQVGPSMRGRLREWGKRSVIKMLPHLEAISSNLGPEFVYPPGLPKPAIQPTDVLNQKTRISGWTNLQKSYTNSNDEKGGGAAT